jgi:hypothetical protein
MKLVPGEAVSDGVALCSALPEPLASAAGDPLAAGVPFLEFIMIGKTTSATMTRATPMAAKRRG